MAKFRNGCYVNNCRGKKYIRISAGPQRGMYVHQLILEAKLGRKLREGEIPDHLDDNGLNNSPDNIFLNSTSGNTADSNKWR